MCGHNEVMFRSCFMTEQVRFTHAHRPLQAKIGANIQNDGKPATETHYAIHIGAFSNTAFIEADRFCAIDGQFMLFAWAIQSMHWEWQNPVRMKNWHGQG
jgi:hypothetical protein